MAGLGGVIGTIIGWVGHHLGQRTDSADANGSAIAQIKELRSLNVLNASKIFPWAEKTVTRTAGGNANNVNANSSIDIISITGPRVVLGGEYNIWYNNGSSPDSFMLWEIIMDGSTIFTVAHSGISSAFTASPANIGLLVSGLQIMRDFGASSSCILQLPIRGPFRFNTSFVIRVRNTHGSNARTILGNAQVWHIAS